MDEQMESDNAPDGSEELSPRDACPYCGGAVLTESEEPLEEYGIEPGCDYYRAEGAGGVIRE